MSDANTNEIHPMEHFKTTSQHLSESTMFATRQAATCVMRADEVHNTVENLDIEEIFIKLRKLVAVINSNDHALYENDIASAVEGSAPAPALMAAE